MNPAKLASWAADPDILRVVGSVKDQLDPALRAAVNAGDPAAIMHAYNQARRLPSGRVPSAAAGERVAAAGPGPGVRIRTGRVGPDDPATGVSIIGNDDPISFGVDVSPSSAVDDSFLARIAAEASPSPYVGVSSPPPRSRAILIDPMRGKSSIEYDLGRGSYEFGSGRAGFVFDGTPSTQSGSLMDLGWDAAPGSGSADLFPAGPLEPPPLGGVDEVVPGKYRRTANTVSIFPPRTMTRVDTINNPSSAAAREFYRNRPADPGDAVFDPNGPGSYSESVVSPRGTTDVVAGPDATYRLDPEVDFSTGSGVSDVLPARPGDDLPPARQVRPDDNFDSVADDIADGGSVETEIDFTEVPNPWAPRPASEAFGWTRADGTPGGVQKAAQFVSRNRYPIGLAGGIAGLYGLNAMLNGESYDPIPAPPGYGASADDDAQQAEDAAMSQASVAANESLILPPQETVDPVPLESLAGAPEFDVGTPELGQPPVEILGSIMAAADSFMPEDSDPSPQADGQFVPGPELTGPELRDAIMKLNREFDRGSITPEAAMTDPVYSRIPGDKLRRLVARGQDLAERQYRRKQAGIFRATNPYGRATQLAAAMYALAPEDRDAFMAHYTLGGPPGQVVSYMDARRDRESGERMKEAELATSERNARTEARGLTSVAGLNAYSAIAKGYYDAQAAKQNAMAQLALVRQQMRNAEMQHREAMQRGDAAAAERARQFALQYQQGATQLEVAIGSLGLKQKEMEASQVPAAARVAEQILAGPVGQQMRQEAQQAQRGGNWSRPLSRDEARGILHRNFGGHTNDVYERILEDVYGPVATN